MTVYRMRSVKGLFVYAPVAPTQECLDLLQELVELHGEVRHIVLPTVAVEHKRLGAKCQRSSRPGSTISTGLLDDF